MAAFAHRILSVGVAGWLAIACRATVAPIPGNRGAGGDPPEASAAPELEWEPLLDSGGVVDVPTQLSLCRDDECRAVARFPAGTRIAMTQRSPSRRFVAVVHRDASGSWQLEAFDATGRGPRWSTRLDGFDGAAAKTYRWLVDDGLLISWSAGAGVESGVAVRDGRAIIDLSATGHDVSPDGEFVVVMTAANPVTTVELLDARTGGRVSSTTVTSYPRVSWSARSLSLDTVASRTQLPLPR